MYKKDFKEYFDRYNKEIYHFALSFLKDPSLAEDLVQDVFLSLWNYKAHVKDGEPIQVLLYTMTRRKVIDYWRKQMASHTFKEHYLRTCVDGFENNTQDQIAFQELHTITEEAYSLLNKSQYQVFELSRTQGLTYDEISRELNISHNTVKYHLKNALKIIRDYLSKHDVIYLLGILLPFVG